MFTCCRALLISGCTRLPMRITLHDVKLVEEKEAINHENRLEDRKDDNVIMCELTEQLDSHEKAEHLINTVIPTKIVHDEKEHTYLSDYSDNSFNCLGSIGSGEVSSYKGEHTDQWTFPKKSTYPSDYGEKLFDHLGGVEEEGYLQWTRIADNHEVQSEKCKKLLIRCNIKERNIHSVNVELYVQKKDQLDEKEGSEKIN